MSYRNYFFALIGLACYLPLRADDLYRDGFIITLDNDTIRGQIEYRSNAQNYGTCVFRYDTAPTVYGPEDIKAFGYDDYKYFLSGVIDDVFVEVLVDGYLSLYKYIDTYFVRKGDATLYPLEYKKVEFQDGGIKKVMNQNKWKGYLSYLTSDCLNDIDHQLRNLKFTEKGISDLVIHYNTCKGSGHVVYKESLPWGKVDVGLNIGLCLSSIRIENNWGDYRHLNSAYTSVDPAMGVVLDFSSPRVSERVSLYSEIALTNASYSGFVTWNKGYEEYHDTYIDLTTLYVPFAFKYNFYKEKFTLYTQLGIEYEYHIRAESLVLTEKIYLGVVDTYPEQEAFPINRHQIGYWGGGGVMKTFRTFRGSLSLRYVILPGLNTPESIIATNNRFFFNIQLLRR